MPGGRLSIGQDDQNLANEFELRCVAGLHRELAGEAVSQLAAAGKHNTLPTASLCAVLIHLAAGEEGAARAVLGELEELARTGDERVDVDDRPPLDPVDAPRRFISGSSRRSLALLPAVKSIGLTRTQARTATRATTPAARPYAR